MRAGVLTALAIVAACTSSAASTRAAEPGAYDRALMGGETPPPPTPKTAPIDSDVDASLAIVGGSGTMPPPLASFHTTDAYLSYSGLAKATPRTSGGGGLEARVGFHSRGVVGFDLMFLGARTLTLGDVHTHLRAPDGTTAEVDVGVDVWEVSACGIGGHLQLGPVVLKASIAPVLEWSTGSGTLTQGFLTSHVSVDASFAAGIDAHLDACAIVKDRYGVCAVAAPRMWRTIDGESGAGNGVYFGLGVQWW